MKNKKPVLTFTEETKLSVGDYFRAYKSRYFVLVKEIADMQRDYEDGYGEFSTTLVKVNIYDKEENLLAENSIVPIDKIISGALAKYIPDLSYDPTYLGSINPYYHQSEHKIWRDMVDRCFDYNNPQFMYIGAVGTMVCDRWRCFEYFFADFKHMVGYSEDIYYKHYIVDLYDTQKYIHPSNRIYAPGYVKLKPFKQSDICMYCNIPRASNEYPKDLNMVAKYKSGEVNVKDTLFAKQTGMDIKIDLDNACYNYNKNTGYQPLVAMINPYMSYTYNIYNNPYYYNQMQQPTKVMCTIVEGR